MLTRKSILIIFLVLSAVAVVSNALSPAPASFYKSIEGVPAVVSGIISMLGLARENKKRGGRKRKSGFAPSIEPTPFRLTPSFESGLYGGLIGGGLSGLIIGVAYYIQSTSWNSRPLGMDIILQIFIYASLVGAIIGASSQLTIIWFRYLAAEKHYSALLFNEVWGGILGYPAVDRFSLRG